MGRIRQGGVLDMGLNWNENGPLYELTCSCSSRYILVR